MKQKTNTMDPVHTTHPDLSAELLAAVLRFAEPRSLVPAATRAFADALAAKPMKHAWVASLLAHRVPAAWKDHLMSVIAIFRRDKRPLESLYPVLADYLFDLAEPTFAGGCDLAQLAKSLAERIDGNPRENRSRSARAEPVLAIMQLLGNALDSPAMDAIFQQAKRRFPRIFHVTLTLGQWAALVKLVIKYDRARDQWLKKKVRFGVFLGMHGELQWKMPDLEELRSPRLDLDKNWRRSSLVHRGLVAALLSDTPGLDAGWGDNP
ncbi:hypothetical protein H9P43_009317 [Blastocladiella emersonii ATCC 22665]|nr:hypothetical protein H9P43_009317 [Blastocladiella emersonii ATCC 22665]